MFHATIDQAGDCATGIGIAILAKAPVAGLAKTRLIPRLGAEGAAALQRWLLQTTVMTALKAGLGPVTLWCTPDTRHADFEACRAFGPITLRQQPEGDLGERMNTAIAESHSPLGCLVVGTDCPVLTPGVLRRAANALHDNEAVVVPAEDGGYVLIGLREADMNVFSGVDWGTSRVMSQTRLRFAVQGALCAELETLWDIDRPEDYERLLEMYPELAALATGGEA